MIHSKNFDKDDNSLRRYHICCFECGNECRRRLMKIRFILLLFNHILQKSSLSVAVIQVVVCVNAFCL